MPARRLGELVEGPDRVPTLRVFTPELALLVDDLVRVDDASLAARPVDAYARVALFALRDARRGEALLAHLTAWAATPQTRSSTPWRVLRNPP